MAVAMRRIALGDLFLHAGSDGELGLGLGLDLVDRDAVGQFAHRDRLAAQRRLEQLLDRGVEGIQIGVEDGGKNDECSDMFFSPGSQDGAAPDSLL